MAMLKLLGRSSSINVRKVQWLLAELGLDHVHQPEWAAERSSRSTEFLALNPNGLVPVLIATTPNGEVVLWESNTICRYLARREGRTDLLPDDALAQARVEQWMDWQTTALNNAWRTAFLHLVRHHPGYSDAAAVATSVAEWNRHMAMLEDQLQRSGGPYVLGPAFTLADIVLGLATHRWLMTPMERPALSAVQAYYDGLTERPGFRLQGRNGVP